MKNKKWVIDKSIAFCYGHRVWVQELDSAFSNDLKCACRFLHGHEGMIQVYLTGDTLNKQSMVTDFRHLEWLKKWIDRYIDHHFVIDRNDPLFNQMIGNRELVGVTLPGKKDVVAWTLDLSDLKEGTPEYEYYEGFLVVNFVPTSENLSAWMAHQVDSKMRDLGVRVSKLDWWETPKSRSSYIMGDDAE